MLMIAYSMTECDHADRSASRRRVSFRCERRLHARLQALARLEGIPLASLVRRLVADVLGRRERRP